MKNLIAFLVLSGTVQAFASASDFVGVYKVGACDLLELESSAGKTARIRLSKGNLEIAAVSDDEVETLELPLKSKDLVSGAGGKKTWQATHRPNLFVGVELLNRRGERGWPDLGAEETTTLKLKEGVLSITKVYKTLWGMPKFDQSYSCTLTAQPRSGVLQFSDIRTLANKDLEKIAKHKVGANLDFDQAGRQLARLSLSRSKLKKQDLVELVSLGVGLSQANISDIKIKAVRAGVSESARAAYGYFTSFANENGEPEYQALYESLDKLAELVDKLEGNFKFYFVDWTESDADGSGLLIIDTDSNEALYFGTGYYS